MIVPELYEAARQLATLPTDVCARVLDEIDEPTLRLTYEALKYDWKLWRRPKQRLPPGDWRWCLFAAGRSFGKTRTSTEILRGAAESGEHAYVSLIGATATTVKRTLLYGPAGVFTISPPWFRPELHSVDEMLVWPKHPITGVEMVCYLMSGEDPDRVRGSEVSLALLDELTTWNRPDEGLMNIDLTLRHGPDPRGVITVTPKRKGAGHQFSRDLLFGKKGTDGKRRLRTGMIIVHGSTFENVDIAERTRKQWSRSYEGTADELSELKGQLSKEAEGALWTVDGIEDFRVDSLPPDVSFVRVVTSVDPTRSQVGAGDLAGIMTGALGSDGHAYIYADDTLRAPPEIWMEKAVSAYELNRSDYGIYEQNRLGEDNVILLSEKARPHGQRWNPITARKKKVERAEPVASLCRSGRVHHVGQLPELEEELCGWDPNESERQASPNRMDAYVHLIRELLLSEQAQRKPLIVR